MFYSISGKVNKNNLDEYEIYKIQDQIILDITYNNIKNINFFVSSLELKTDDFRFKNNFPIRWASENGHLEVVKYLIEKIGLNINDITSLDNYAIQMSKGYGHTNISSYLEDKIKELEAKEQHKKEWYYVCNELESKPQFGKIKNYEEYFGRLFYEDLCKFMN